MINFNQILFHGAQMKKIYNLIFSIFIFSNTFCLVEFTPNGIQTFLKETFNHPDYAEKVLPHSYNDFREFLKFGYVTDQGTDYQMQVLHIFRYKTFECDFISAGEVLNIVNFLNSNIVYLQSNKNKHNAQVEVIRNICYNSFLNNFEAFQNKPDEFITELAKKIVDTMDYTTCDIDCNSKSLQCELVKFLETILAKTIWSIEDQSETIDDFLQIGDSVLRLYKSGAISEKGNLQDILKLLTERFVYFVSICSDHLNDSFFEEAESKIFNFNVEWLNVEEPEAELIPKIERLRTAMIKSKVLRDGKRI